MDNEGMCNKQNLIQMLGNLHEVNERTSILEKSINSLFIIQINYNVTLSGIHKFIS